MAARKKKNPLARTLKKISSGIKKFSRKTLRRLNQLKAPPHSIAAGFACGVAISFTPFVGFHGLLAAAIAWIIRGNVLAALLGTIVGNPWTFPFIWVSVLYTGRYMLGESIRSHIEFSHIFESSLHALITFDFKLFINDAWPIIWPMIVGCIPYFILSWLLSYYLLNNMLTKISAARNRHLEHLSEKDK